MTIEIWNCYSGGVIALSTLQILIWPIDKLVFYARNPRKNDAAVDHMCSSIREFGFKIPVLARSNGEVVDGHLCLKAARKLGSWLGGDVNGIPGDPVRRMDAAASEGIPADGEWLSKLADWDRNCLLWKCRT